jgi:hypothetical protein
LKEITFRLDTSVLFEGFLRAHLPSYEGNAWVYRLANATFPWGEMTARYTVSVNVVQGESEKGMEKREKNVKEKGKKRTDQGKFEFKRVPIIYTKGAKFKQKRS